MSVLPPVRKDRVIARLPQCFRKDAALHTKEDFSNKVKTACQEQRTGTVGFKISKVIVVGDLAVGKTCLINRFCKDVFDKNYKATIGVDFEMERFEVLGVPFSLQLWDTAGQERFKCIASTYYRGAQVVIIAFDLNDIGSFSHVRQWLEDSLKENDPTAVQLFLVGTKKDLSVPARYSQMEQDALKLAQEISAEYWAVSSLTGGSGACWTLVEADWRDFNPKPPSVRHAVGENVNEFFFRVASLAFETSVLAELEKSGSRQIGQVVSEYPSPQLGRLRRAAALKPCLPSVSGINSDSRNLYTSSKKKQSNCCQ
ncbi:unnamed protein product, partial [Tetraodon nigroviridis]